jgi:peptide-methionine (S)-S-oxide reductase
MALADSVRRDYDRALRDAGHDPITTEVEGAGSFYYGPDAEQQYLHKQPDAIHCALVGTGLTCRVAVSS